MLVWVIVGMVCVLRYCTFDARFVVFQICVLLWFWFCDCCGLGCLLCLCLFYDFWLWLVALYSWLGACLVVWFLLLGCLMLWSAVALLIVLLSFFLLRGLMILLNACLDDCLGCIVCSLCLCWCLV